MKQAHLIQIMINNWNLFQNWKQEQELERWQGIEPNPCRTDREKEKAYEAFGVAKHYATILGVDLGED